MPALGLTFVIIVHFYYNYNSSIIIVLVIKHYSYLILPYFDLQEMGGKSEEGKCGKNIDNPDKSTQLKASASLQQSKCEILPAGSNSGHCNDGNIQTVFRKLQPQINLKRCNIFYNYTTISVIKQICLRGCPKEKVHLFGVVNKIIKVNIIQCRCYSCCETNSGIYLFEYS